MIIQQNSSQTTLKRIEDSESKINLLFCYFYLEYFMLSHTHIPFFIVFHSPFLYPFYVIGEFLTSLAKGSRYYLVMSSDAMSRYNTSQNSFVYIHVMYKHSTGQSIASSSYAISRVTFRPCVLEFFILSATLYIADCLICIEQHAWMCSHKRVGCTMTGALSQIMFHIDWPVSSKVCSQDAHKSLKLLPVNNDKNV